VFHAIVRVVDGVQPPPTAAYNPKVERLLRENQAALKAQVRALVLELKADKGRHPKVSMRTQPVPLGNHFPFSAEYLVVCRYYISTLNTLILLGFSLS